jgi:DNA-directed RNA polymerase specialized sigma24 family protein
MLVPVIPVLMTLEDKRRFLTARRTLAGIRRVARSRGVLAQDHEDIVQQTCAAAWRARLPADTAGARRVVNRIAFAVACTHMRRDPADGTCTNDETRGEVALVAHAADPAYEVGVREQVRLLLEEGRARFPNRLDAFVASAVGGVTAKEEAARRGVTESHVRKERSEIRAFLANHGQKIGVILAAAMVLLVIGSMTDWRRQLHATVADDGSLWTPRIHHAPLAAADAASLRARAAESFREGAYEACLEDLDAARALDGREDTVDEAQMRADAMRVLRVDEAEDPSWGRK